MSFLRAYGVTLDGSTPGSLKIRLGIRKRDGSDWSTSSDWTPAAGDVKVSKDFGAEANIGTLPTYNSGAWEFVLSGTELTAKVVTVRVADAAVDLVDFDVETFGNASACYGPDYANATNLGLANLDATTSSRHASGAAVASVSGAVGSVTGAVGSVTNPVTVGTNNDKAGYSLAATGLDLVLASATGAVAIGTAARDAILNRALAGNHDVAGSPGKLLQDAATASALTTLSGLATAIKAVTDLLPNGGALNDLAALAARLTNARAGYLDNLDVGGAVATQADINALNQSASRRVILATVQAYERPDSGSTTYTVEARTYTADGVPANADSTPTLTATGQTSGSLAANLGAATNPATGVYRWSYAVASSATLEPIRFDLAATIGGDSCPLAVYTQTTDAVAIDFTADDRAKLVELHGKLPSAPYLLGSSASDGSGFATSSQATGLATDVAAVLAEVQAVPTAAEMLAALQAGGTKLTELHATLSASGVFSSAAFASLGQFAAGDRTKLEALYAMLSASGVLSAGAFANLPVPATAATLAKQTEILTAIAALALDGGTGAHLVTFKVTGASGEDVAGVVVTLRKSGSPAERYLQVSDGDGLVSFSLDTGDWIRTLYKSGLSHTPDVLTVAGDLPEEGDDPEEVAMTSTVSPPPSSPGLVTARILLVGGTGSATIRLKTPPAGSGLGVNSRARTATPVLGVCYWADCVPGGEYEIKLGSSSSWYPQTFTIPADQVGDFDIDNVLGVLEDA